MEQTATAPVSFGRRLLDLFGPETWKGLAYLLLSFPIGLFCFIFLVVGLSVGFSTLIIWIGVPILVGVMLGSRAIAYAERAWANWALGAGITVPYRRLPEGNWFARLKAVAADPATWKDIFYLAVLFPLGLLWFTVSVVLWSTALAMLTLPIYFPFLPDSQFAFVDTDATNWVIDSYPEALLAAAAGVVVVVIAALATRGMASANRAIAKGLLGPSAGQLKRQVEALQHSRRAASEGAETERRRIERDLHDGAQQQLVSLAMNLGMAKEKMADDPEAAAELVDRAHSDAKRAMVELRELARGIHSAVLADRGLDAAISALVARSAIPVDVRVETERMPSEVESAAYFVVAESLANVAKHANAGEVSVRVVRTGGQLIVEIQDDGIGGADPAVGSGLTGLQERVAGVGGTLAILSPVGGPTRVRAELPCGW